MDLPVVAHILEVEGELGPRSPVTLVLHERWPAIEHPPRPWSGLGGRSRTDYPDRIPEDEWRGVPRQIHLHADYHHQRAEVETVAKKAKERVRQVKAGLAEKLAEMAAVAVAVDCCRVLPGPLL